MQILHQTFLRRELVKISDNVIHDAQNPDIEIPAQTQIEAAEQHLFTLAEDDTAEQGLKSFDLVLAETINIAESATKTEGSLSGISTGLTGLNNLLGGLHKSDLLILAGRPAMVKLLSQQILLFMLRRQHAQMRQPFLLLFLFGNVSRAAWYPYPC